ASGPAGPYADLTLIGTPRAQRLRRVLGQAAHLLAPTDPPHSLADILYSRISHDRDWGAQAQALTDSRKLPALINHWPLPDLPHPALRRILTGHTDSVITVAIAPDSTWLASASWDRSVRIWDAATGQQRATLFAGRTGSVMAVAIAPDGTWLASASRDSMRIWDAATGQQRPTLFGEELVELWAGATGRHAILIGRTGVVTGVAIAPDGTWPVGAVRARPVRIWDPATGQQRATLTGHTLSVTAVAIAPDGTWLASASWDRSVRTWDPATGQQRATLTGRTGSVMAVAVPPGRNRLRPAGPGGAGRTW